MNRWAGIMLKFQDALGVGVARATRGTGPMSTREDAVAPFHALSIDLPATVRVIKGEGPLVRWRAPANLLPSLVSTVRGGQLHLDLRGSAWTRHPLEVDVVCPEPLTTVKVNGPSDVVLTHLADRVSLICRGPSNVSGEGIFTLIKASISGAGKLTLKGRAECLILEQSGVGNADLRALIARRATVHAEGVGEVFMRVTEDLHAQVEGLTHVKVRGNPPHRQVVCARLSKVSFA